MHRRSVRLAAAICTLISYGLLARADERPSASKPNIIYILADDLGYGDLGCYGQARIRTPRIDRLAREGIRFTQHYAGSTVCAPSRCTLMTGMHTGHATIRGNGRVPLRTEDVTVADLCKQAGYTTACIGKWGLGEADSTGAPWRQGFDYFFGYLNQRNAHFYYPPFLWRNTEKVRFPDNKRKQRTGQYSHDLMTDEALAFVRRSAGQPFFLYLAYTIPHAENTVPRDSLAPYLGEFPEKPHHDRHYGRQATPRASYAGMISRLDRDVGRLMDLLGELGLDDQTLVMFSSDNGPSRECGPTIQFFDSSGGLRGIKRDLYEGGVRTPLIARWPGKAPAGRTSDRLTANWDFLPTVTDLVGAKAPSGVDGVSILPTLFGRDAEQREHEYLYWEFFEQGGKQAVRLGNWKGVRRNVSKNPNAPIELYNLAADPVESTNVAAAHPGTALRVAEIMQRARVESPHFRF